MLWLTFPRVIVHPYAYILDKECTQSEFICITFVALSSPGKDQASQKLCTGILQSLQPTAAAPPLELFEEEDSVQHWSPVSEEGLTHAMAPEPGDMLNILNAKDHNHYDSIHALMDKSPKDYAVRSWLHHAPIT